MNERKRYLVKFMSDKLNEYANNGDRARFVRQINAIRNQSKILTASEKRMYDKMKAIVREIRT